MKKISIIFASLVMVGCSTSHQSHDNVVPKPSFDWSGVYEGVLPCADCEGIKTKLTLNQDGFYKLEQVYEKGKNSYMPAPEIGKIEWDKTKPLIYLKSNAETSIFYIDKDKVVAYDTEGNPINSRLNYTLKKIIQ